ncbi:hypothetical protein EYF80_065750 [Liparis tanakae]|uniref:Uncharacterized protein n=1 Tax=Liparis tanakae TaxID=230148 RepID=A0A4Z2E5C8_9TELE|nr:hypothetical protein EYF80_065750 [Liparis tanakae]
MCDPEEFNTERKYGIKKEKRGITFPPSSQTPVVARKASVRHAHAHAHAHAVNGARWGERERERERARDTDREVH